ncbi:hypothetical protein CYG49_01355 [Candidatus Saccharibacteria bacterium]|nr:MAG: hypothetical protein CYG49_01355 [Candidatus Saccharibacteria bacterium]
MKDKIQKLLEWRIKRYFKKHDVKLVVITGSVGKTGTKTAIATVLKERFKVRAHEGNHNTHLSAPLAMLGVPYPEKVKSPIEWFKAFLLLQAKIFGPKDIDIVVQELGTDAPGDIPQFGKYLSPDIAVVTAVSAEHMEFFKTIDAVAKEELAVASFSKLTVINRDDIDESYAQYAETNSITTYGTSGIAEYHYTIENVEHGQGFTGKFTCPEFGSLDVPLQLVGEHNIKAAVAAGVVGVKLGLSKEQIISGMSKIKPAPGRMQLLRGVEGSTIIDDTYNSSPLAVKAAIQTLYSFPAPQRIAILGSMNELGTYTAQAHEEVGRMCDVNMLSWVLTIGDDAEKYIAPVASSNGCQVRSFKNPYDAGAFARKVIEPGTVVLVKGSQNGVYSEEAIKNLLHSTADEEKLVRQSRYWLDRKHKQFFSE